MTSLPRVPIKNKLRGCDTLLPPNQSSSTGRVLATTDTSGFVASMQVWAPAVPLYSNIRPR
jgi:hypothetical protein